MSGLGSETRDWLASLGIEPITDARWLEALTHGSMGDGADYERLEFLGDRVLGLAIAEWLFEESASAEGRLSQRLNALVSRQTCARGQRKYCRGGACIFRRLHRDAGRDQ